MTKSLLERINARMHEGTCPSKGSLGECPALEEVVERQTFHGPRVLVRAAVSIWEPTFNDCESMAAWFKAEGALEVSISHVLHDPFNETAAGFNVDSSRDWIVDAQFPVGHASVVDITEPRDGIDHIEAERARQKSVEGRDAEHDSQYVADELARAAACYALPITDHRRMDAVIFGGAPKGWPWDATWWKPAHVYDDGRGNPVIEPGARIRELEKAGALIAAEIDRIKQASGDQPRAGAA